MKHFIPADKNIVTHGLWLLSAFCGIASMMSLFACAPLAPNKIKLASQLQVVNGVIGYWNFDEKTKGTAPGGADFADSSGKNHPGTATGSLQLGTKGVKDSAVYSDGTGGVTIPIDLSAEKTITVSVWVNQTITATQSANIVYEYTSDSSSQNGFMASLDTNSLGLSHSFLFYMHGGSGPFAQSAPTLPSFWHNVITVYDQSVPSQNTITVFIDGTLTSTTTVPGLNVSNAGAFANSNLYLLRRADTTLAMAGQIDEVILWNRALTANEIQTLIAY